MTNLKKIIIVALLSLTSCAFADTIRFINQIVVNGQIGYEEIIVKNLHPEVGCEMVNGNTASTYSFTVISGTTREKHYTVHYRDANNVWYTYYDVIGLVITKD